MMQDKDNNPVVGLICSVSQSVTVQGPAKEWSLGCVKRAPRPREEARRRESRNLGPILEPIPVSDAKYKEALLRAQFD